MGSYSKDDNYVYYFGKPIIGADPESFIEFRNSNYTKDKNSGYFRGEKIEGSHGTSFEYVGSRGWDTNEDGIWGIDEFAKDKYCFYRNGKQTFRIPPSVYSSD